MQLPVLRKAALSTIAALFVLGCGAQAKRPVRSVLPPAPTLGPDAEQTLDAPTINHVFGLPAPEGTVITIPYSVISISGLAPGASDVLIEGTTNRTSRTLPDGSFCVDLTDLPPAQYDLLVTGYNGSQFSPSVSLSVKIDPNSPPPDPIFTEAIETCRGLSPSACENVIEDCNNGVSDNCNSYVDGDDPQCIDCYDDGFDVGGESQQNDTYSSAIRPAEGQNYDLTICPADNDYFIIDAEAGEQIVVTIALNYNSPALYAELLSPNSQLQPISSTKISSTATKTITHTVAPAQGGAYRLRVFGLNSDTNDYRLQITVGSPAP
ncbi:MAG: hypothetical protein IPJ88_05430 [Myxococcales bacterium]|nr:MAG: hypothetical protein IPJ88_05430 [Myxococcales bacterium]